MSATGDYFNMIFDNKKKGTDRLAHIFGVIVFSPLLAIMLPGVLLQDLWNTTRDVFSGGEAPTTQNRPAALTCPHCSEKLQIAADGLLSCPSCQTTFSVEDESNSV